MESGTGITGTDSVWMQDWHEGRYYCRCGAMLEITAAPHVVAEAKRLFWRQHDGPGHGMCDKRQAEYNRTLAEQEELGA